MKALLASIVLLTLFCAAFARDITTINGTVYKNVTVTRKDSTGIGISHNDGFTFLEFSQLPPGLEKEFGFDRTAYDAAIAQRDAGDAAMRKQQNATAAVSSAKEAQQRAEQERLYLNALTKLQTVPQPPPRPPGQSIAERDYSTNDYSTRSYSTPRYTDRSYGGGTVHVSGYTRKDGTYVRPHTRRAPR
jgi:hypothetical protein